MHLTSNRSKKTPPKSRRPLKDCLVSRSFLRKKGAWFDGMLSFRFCTALDDGTRASGCAVGGTGKRCATTRLFSKTSGRHCFNYGAGDPESSGAFEGGSVLQGVAASIWEASFLQPGAR